MLGGLALRGAGSRRAGRPQVDRQANIVMGINVQVCWEKFANYFEVEPRQVPMEGDRFHLTGDEAIKLVDENTIGVVAVLGSTFDGSYEPIAEIAAASTGCRSKPAWTFRSTSTAPRADDRAFPRSGAGVGLPDPESGEHQHLRPQVRLVFPGRRLGHLARSTPLPRS